MHASFILFCHSKKNGFVGDHCRRCLLSLGIIFQLLQDTLTYKYVQDTSIIFDFMKHTWIFQNRWFTKTRDILEKKKTWFCASWCAMYEHKRSVIDNTNAESLLSYHLGICLVQNCLNVCIWPPYWLKMLAYHWSTPNFM